MSRMNLAERASIMATSDMVDDCASGTAAGWLCWQSRASCRWTARAILLILSSSSRRLLALSLWDCARRRLVSSSSSSSSSSRRFLALSLCDCALRRLSSAVLGIQKIRHANSLVQERGRNVGLSIVAGRLIDGWRKFRNRAMYWWLCSLNNCVVGKVVSYVGPL
jgi:hypothetical protein